jgi:hypothetical protein
MARWLVREFMKCMPGGARKAATIRQVGAAAKRTALASRRRYGYRAAAGRGAPQIHPAVAARLAVSKACGTAEMLAAARPGVGNQPVDVVTRNKRALGVGSLRLGQCTARAKPYVTATRGRL